MTMQDVRRPYGAHAAADPDQPTTTDCDDVALSALSPYLRRRCLPLDTSAEGAAVLADPGRMLVVESGAVDLFAARLSGGAPVGRWTSLCRLQAGAVLGPGSLPGPSHVLIGRPVPGAVLSALPLAELRALSGSACAAPAASVGTAPVGAAPVDTAPVDTAPVDPVPIDTAPVDSAPVAAEIGTADMAAAVDEEGAGAPAAPTAVADLDVLQASQEILAGIEMALDAMTRAMRQGLPPREFSALEPCRRVRVAKGEVLRSVAGVQWVDVLDGAVTSGDAGSSADYATGDRVCVTELDWLTATADTELQVRPTAALLRCGELVRTLLLHAFRFGYAVDRAVEAQRQRESQLLESMRDNEDQSIRRVTQTFDELIAASAGEPVVAVGGRTDRALRCVQVAGRRAGIDIDAVGDADLPADDRAAVEQITARAGVPTRGVRLVGRWWRTDRGPLVAFRRQDGRALALLPIPGGYLSHDPDQGGVHRIDAATARTVRIDAVMMYRALPRDVAGLGSLLRFGLSGGRKELLRFAGIALSVALLGLLVPVLTGTVLGSWVPAAQRGLLIGASVLIMASGLVTAALTVVQNTAVLRLEGQFDLTVQAAVWSRLLSLPINFFARFAAAELGTVALGVSAARETLSSVSTIAALGLLSGGVNLIALFFFSVPLGAIAVAMVGVSAFVSAVLARRGVRRQRDLYRSEQRLASRSYQFLSGLSTLRLAAAEGRAYARWSQTLTENLRHGLSVRRAQAAVTVFNSGFSVVCTLGIFALVGGPFHSSVSLAAFLSFFTAFNQVLGALVQFCSAGVAALAVVPVLEGLMPILDAKPEVREEMSPPGDLEGRIEVRNVSFRYGDGPAVLDGVSFDVAPGEFVALVGSTGSGKSTVLRLLLGFEEAQSGSILFDGQDVRRLDVTALRRQCGVVLQNGALLAGDVATNIIAGSAHTVDDAWRAAELAGIAADIRAMPMAMNTVIPEGGMTLSGGQRQRLMIARALISSPRILFFDEATSALDNRTQRIITESTRRLNASRLVIAHRLSTIEHADRIVVLDGGKVAQIGTYAELVDDRGGVFARLVRRQMAQEPA